ncbi:MAG: hypothetical protein N3A65_06735 [candidate division WOR-3 bacterium]|nr:hypothetical protein [candidate division WOR-3 bacterium]
MILLLISAAGVAGLLMPPSAKGLLTYYSRTGGNEAIFYNPSLFIASEDRYGLNFSYAHIYHGMKNMNMGIGKRFNTLNLGISIMNFDYGDIEARPDYPTRDSTGYYTGNDFCLGFLVSRDITKNGRIGFKIKYIYENLYVYSGSTLGLDLALAYMNEISGLSVGATNIGGTIKIANEEVNLPAKLSVGYYRILKKFTLSSDIHYLVNISSFECALAVEVKVSDLFDTGFSINYRDEFYPGFYIALQPGALQITYGASFYPYNLGMVNIIGIGISF